MVAWPDAQQQRQTLMKMKLLNCLRALTFGGQLVLGKQLVASSARRGMDHTEDARLDKITRPPPWRHVELEKIERGAALRCTMAVRGLCGHVETSHGSVRPLPAVYVWSSKCAHLQAT